jgi:esterase/lipase superfamily enzyme
MEGNLNHRLHKNRLGRGVVLWIAGAAATVTVGGMMMPSSDTSSRSDSQQIATALDSKDASQSSAGTNASSSELRSMASGVVSLPAINEETSIVEAPESAIKSPSTDEISEQTAAPNTVAAKPPVDRSRVELFYATDRKLLDPWSIQFWMMTAICVPLAIVGTGLCIAGTFYGQRRFIWGLGLIGGVVLCGLVGLKTAQRYNQAVRLSNIGGVYFSGSRNDASPSNAMHFGSALVTLPPTHMVGRVERPNAFLLEYDESPDKHVMVRRMKPLAEVEFYQGLKNKVSQATKSSVLVFIHGYNVAFDDALLRAAQLASDLEYDGVPLLYSWPSNGRLTKYRSDEENAQWSVPHLEKLLIDIKETSGAQSVHVIVHSMGNRVLMGAVERLTLRYPSKQPMLDQVVMAAPDVDVGQFESRYLAAVDEASKQTTLYTSAGDKALLASAVVNRVERLGLSSAAMKTFYGIDTVDVSEIDTSLLGHSYYGSQEVLIKDIRALIELGEPPLQRKWLQEVSGTAEPVLWRIAESVNRATR